MMIPAGDFKPKRGPVHLELVSTISDLTSKISVFWKSGGLREVMAQEDSGDTVASLYNRTPHPCIFW